MFQIKVAEKIKTHILYSVTSSENRVVYEIMSKKCGGDRGATNDIKIWRIRVACWISKAIWTYAHAHVHALGYPHARTQAHAYTHGPINYTYYFSTATMMAALVFFLPWKDFRMNSIDTHLCNKFVPEKNSLNIKRPRCEWCGRPGPYFEWKKKLMLCVQQILNYWIKLNVNSINVTFWKFVISVRAGHFCRSPQKSKKPGYFTIIEHSSIYCWGKEYMEL